MNEKPKAARPAKLPSSDGPAEVTVTAKASAKGKAKGARLHSFGACREAFYVAEEKARLREGAAKLRADEDREDSSSDAS